MLAYHAKIPGFSGGFLGVDAFFVVSGFLITSLMLNEVARTGTVDLRAFWIRRARRLLPAVGALLLVVSVVLLTFSRTELRDQRGDVFAALTYVSNWYQIVAGRSYFEAFSRPPLLRHLWSLAVEEQFYLVCPLVFFALRGVRSRWKVGALFGAVGLALSGWMRFLFDRLETPPSPNAISKIYLRTDTRAPAILIGAAFGVAFVSSAASARRRNADDSPRAFGSHSWGLDVMGLACVGVLATIVVLARETSPWLYRGGFLAFSTALGIFLICVCSESRRLWSRRWLAERLPSRIGGLRPLRWIGLRSYSLYLWHWPIFIYLRPGEELSGPRLPIEVLRFGLSLFAAELSYRFVETPLRHGRTRRTAGTEGRRRALYGALALPASMLLVGLVTVPSRQTDLAKQLRLNASALSRPAEENPGTQPAAASEVDPTVPSVPTTSRVPLVVAPGEVANRVPEDRSPPTTVPVHEASPPLLVRGVAIGDSVQLGGAIALRARMGKFFDIDAKENRSYGAGLQVLRKRIDNGSVGDVVVLHLGTNGPESKEKIEETLDLLGPEPLVVLVTASFKKASWVSELNTSLTAIADERANVVVADWNTVATLNPAAFYRDLVHVRPEFAFVYADLIADTVARACHLGRYALSVASTVDAGLVPGGGLGPVGPSVPSDADRASTDAPVACTRDWVDAAQVSTEVR